MTFWWILACTLALAYAVLMALYFRAWRSIPVWETPAGYRPHTRLSVLVPARNEEARIDACLQALLAVDYPPELLEVLIIDDFSDDQTAARVLAVEDPRLRLIRLADEESLPAGNFGKKQALATGVRHATGALIATTDADCLPSPDWLRSLASFYEAGHWKIMAGPVQFVGEKNAFQRFQSLDMLGMVYRTVRQGVIDMAEMFRLMDTPVEVQDAPGAPALVIRRPAVTFDNVTFGYDPDRTILHGLSFEVPAGGHVALVGPSGAGKSTIGRLLFRFYDPWEGRILIDGQDIAQVTQASLRAIWHKLHNKSVVITLAFDDDLVEV